MSGCGKSECMGHGHYEICGKEGQMGIFECDGCKVKHLTANLERIIALVDRAAGDRTYGGNLIDDIRAIIDPVQT